MIASGIGTCRLGIGDVVHRHERRDAGVDPRHVADAEALPRMPPLSRTIKRTAAIRAK
jgi:hypothetical protein